MMSVFAGILVLLLLLLAGGAAAALVVYGRLQRYHKLRTCACASMSFSIMVQHSGLRSTGTGASTWLKAVGTVKLLRHGINIRMPIRMQRLPDVLFIPVAS